MVATAELMVEMGRRFDDNKICAARSIEYRFLRKEYPGSKYRFDALFTIGEIYKDDLNDPEEARTTFTDSLHRYPRNRLADDARAAVRKSIRKSMPRPRRRNTRRRRRRASNGPHAGNGAGNHLVTVQLPARPPPVPFCDIGESGNAANVRRSGCRA